MSKKNLCSVCGTEKSHFVMNNKRVCMRCDELLFDIEIECEEMPRIAATDGATKPTSETTADKKAAR